MDLQRIWRIALARHTRLRRLRRLGCLQGRNPRPTQAPLCRSERKTDQGSADFNAYDDALKAAAKKADITLDTKEKKQIADAVSWKNPAAEKVIKKLHKGKANPLYGLFAVNGEIVEYQSDGELRDFENIALDPNATVNTVNEAYFIKEVQPHVPDAWIDAGKCDAKDGEIGIVGYEIPFNRHFYQYQPPRDLVEIDADLDAVSAEIMALLREVHS